MGSPSDNTANLLNRPYVSKGWFPSPTAGAGFVDQFTRKIPLQRIEKPTINLSWDRFDPSVGSLTVNPYATGGTPSSVQLEVIQTTRPFQRIGAMALVDSLAEAASGIPNDLLMAQIQAAKIGIIRTLGSQIITGDGISPHLNGFDYEIYPATQGFSVSMVSGFNVPSVQDILYLINLVKASDGSIGRGYADCIVTHERVIRFIVFYATQQASGLIDYVYDSDLGVQVPRFAGVPMYNGQIPTSGTTGYEIYALKMSGPTGIRLLHATGSSDQFGIDITPIPMQSTVAQRGAYVGGYYCLMVPEVQSLARCIGTDNTGLNHFQIS